MSAVLAEDRGHGGADTGAVGPFGTAESGIVFDVGARLRQVAEAHGVRVVSTRTTNTRVSLGTRCRYANDAGAAAFISIHANCGSALVRPGPDGYRYDQTAMGCEVWTSKGDTLADPLATMVMAGIESRLPGLVYRRDFADGDCDKERRPGKDDLYVLRRTRMPAVLVELAFVSNPAEEAMLRKPEVQLLYAEGMFWGFMQWMKWVREQGGPGAALKAWKARASRIGRNAPGRPQDGR